MLKVEDNDYYAEVVKEAKKLGLYENKDLNGDLKGQLDYLHTYADHEKVGATQCRLYRDSAPRSFYFLMEKRSKDGEYKRWFNGGLIFHGELDTGVGAPTFSVRIGDTSSAGWSVHT